ncbi:MAG: AI-2E family transporter [Chromatocurvus sp.]
MPAVAEPAQEQEPRPRTSFAMRCLLFLGIAYTMYFAQSLLIPMVVALFFALLLSPLVDLLKRFYVPRTLSAVLMLCVIGGPLGLLVSQLAEPAQRWAKEMPELADQVTQHVENLTQRFTPEAALEPPDRKGFSFSGLFDDDDEQPGDAKEQSETAGSGFSETIKQSGLEAILAVLSAAPVMIAQLLIAVMLILFLLIFGSGLFVTWVNAFPGIDDKERSIALMRSIQVELSRYILTVSVINGGLGLVVAAALWSLGFDDALFWGAVVGLLNFAPYVGPLIGAIILSLAGVVQYGIALIALLPVLVYFSINMLEAQFVTPVILGHRMRLNPLIIIVWLVAWGWLWGAVGVLLAVPMLVCFKIAAKQTRVMDHWVELIESRA